MGLSARTRGDKNPAVSIDKAGARRCRENMMVGANAGSETVRPAFIDPKEGRGGDEEGIKSVVVHVKL